MKTAELKAIVREKTGANDAKKLRRDSKIPAVLYGEFGVKHLAVDYNSAAKLINTPNLYLINLNADGDNRRVIVQDTQYHPITDQLTHIDFLEAIVGKSAKLRIPVRVTGDSIGVMNGGQLVVKMRNLFIKGVPAELPEFIEIDISDLDIGKSIKVKDIEGFEILDSENAVIVRVKAARNIEELLAPVEEELEEGEEGEGEEGAEGEGTEGEAKEGEGGDAKAEGKSEGNPEAGGDEKKSE